MLGLAGGAIRPGGDADTIAGAVGEDPGCWGLGIVDDPAAGCQSGGQPLLGLFSAYGYVDVHRVTQGLGRVEALHPDRRSVAKGVNGVVLGQLAVPEYRPPEADVDRIGVGRDGERHLLRQSAVGRSSAFPATAETAWASSTCRSSSWKTPRVSRTPSWLSVIVISTPPSPGICATASANRAAAANDGTRKTAVAPPCSTTQSATPSAARNRRHPCSLTATSHREMVAKLAVPWRTSSDWGAPPR